MFFLLSGEGATDMGICNQADSPCRGEDHYEGPMAIIASQIVEAKRSFSFIETNYYAYVSESTLSIEAKQLAAIRKTPSLRGKKRPKETLYFFKHARALGRIAMQYSKTEKCDVVAIYFRDSDGTVSASRGEWRHRWDSMIRGFEEQGFHNGVPMIPKPKSEAWIICALKDDPYQGCDALEDRSGNDHSPNSLKKELEYILGHSPTRDELCELLNKGKIDHTRITMSSFKEFRDRLGSVIC